MSEDMEQFDDIEDILTKALTASKGVRLVFVDERFARAWKMNAYKFLNAHRKESAGDHTFDCLSFVGPVSEGVVEIRKDIRRPIRIEEIE